MYLTHDKQMGRMIQVRVRLATGASRYRTLAFVLPQGILGQYINPY